LPAIVFIISLPGTAALLGRGKVAEEFDNLCKAYRIASGNPRKAGDIDYILPNGDMIYSVRSLSDRELKLARNEIYARRGYIFSDVEMAEYFAKKAWYNTTSMEFR
jgi:hypothetical protein